MAEAPVPMTATRLPASGTSDRHRAECQVGPAKSSRPGMSGSLGRLSWPTALITAWACRVSSPAAVRTRTAQRCSGSDHSAASTSVPKRIRSRSPNTSAQSRK
jgi:hypothetical protein